MLTHLTEKQQLDVLKLLIAGEEWQTRNGNSAARAKAKYVLTQINNCAEIAQRISPSQTKQPA